MTVTAPDARTLVGHVVRLDPTVADDAAALFTALDDERVYAAGFGGGPAGRPADAAGMHGVTLAAVRDRELGPGHPSYRVAYTVRLLDDTGLGHPGQVVGTTSIGDVVLADERAHVGWTGYGPRWWGSTVNPDCKLLLLTHLFEDCGLGRVKLQTDLINERSQAAIARLGATREGVLRRHKRRADGSFRDTVVYSILRQEWPEVRERLRGRVGWSD
jgi:RimJ/RimL family protein N-acetyltransferase